MGLGCFRRKKKKCARAAGVRRPTHCAEPDGKGVAQKRDRPRYVGVLLPFFPMPDAADGLRRVCCLPRYGGPADAHVPKSVSAGGKGEPAPRGERFAALSVPEARPAAVDPSDPIRKGERGEHVRLLQRFLNELAAEHPALPRIEEDGIFGDWTLAAVVTFQTLFSLDPDGVVGPATWNKIVDVHDAD